MGNSSSSNRFAGKAVVQETQLSIPCTFPVDSFPTVQSTARQQAVKRKRRSSVPNEVPAFHPPVQAPQENKRVRVQDHQYAPINTQPVASHRQVVFQQVINSSRMRAPEAPAEPEGGFSLEQDFKFIRKLGESTEGKVFLMKSKKPSNPAELYALKVLKEKPRSSNVADVPEECLLHLNAIRMHPHIVFCSQIDIVNGSILQCLEFANAGDLMGYCERRQRFHISPQGHHIWCLMVIAQLSEAIAYLHHGLRRQGEWLTDCNHRSINHLDIKPQNIMLHFGPNDMWPILLLGDFGHATLATRPMRIAGTELYSSPEAAAAARGENAPLLSSDSDVYTFALTIIFLITGTHFRTGTNPRFLRLPDEYEKLGLTRMLQCCLAINPRIRPTMTCDSGHGILPIVEESRNALNDLIARHGHLDTGFWGSWKKESLQMPM